MLSLELMSVSSQKRNVAQPPPQASRQALPRMVTSKPNVNGRLGSLELRPRRRRPWKRGPSSKVVQVMLKYTIPRLEVAGSGRAKRAAGSHYQRRPLAATDVTLSSVACLDQCRCPESRQRCVSFFHAAVLPHMEYVVQSRPASRQGTP